MKSNAAIWLERINAIVLPSPVNILNVCGGHERTLEKNGIRSLLPENVQIVPGPGCPVCVCPEEILYAAIQLAQRDSITLACFGDMLRVPCNMKKNAINTLEKAKSSGFNVISIASPMEVLALAKEKPNQNIVFFVAGFETTLAPIAAMIAEGLPDNIQFLLAARRTWPIVNTLLSQEQHNLHGIVAPGHVATVMGSEEWRFITERYNLPCAIAGFESDSLLAAIHQILLQHSQQLNGLTNCYPSVVKADGNRVAQAFIQQIFDIEDVNWRGIGCVSQSGYQFKSQYSALDVLRTPEYQDLDYRLLEHDMPPGCDCGKVVSGNLQPLECRLYGSACTPASPIGPCMVSDEGACHIWWNSGRRKSA